MSIFQWDFLEKVTVFLRDVALYCTKCGEAPREEVFMIPGKKIAVSLSGVKSLMNKKINIHLKSGTFSVFSDVFYDSFLKPRKFCRKSLIMELIVVSQPAFLVHQ